MKVFFLDEINASISSLWIKQIVLLNVSGPHSISWRTKEKKTDLSSPPKRGGNSASRLPLASSYNTNSSFSFQPLAYPADFGPASPYNCVSPFLRLNLCLSLSVSLCLHICMCAHTHTHVHTFGSISLGTLINTREWVMVPTLKRLFVLRGKLKICAKIL